MAAGGRRGETVVIVFAMAIAIAFIVVTIGVVVIEVVSPEQDTSAVAAALGGVFASMLAATVGYVLGRRGT